MEQADQPIEQRPNTPPFNEEAWIKLVFLLSDTQDWLNELANGALMQVPMKNRKRLLRKTYYLPLSSLAHILERHHYKIPRHPGTSKFTIPVPEILSYLRDISAEPGTPIAGSLDFKRVVNVGRVIGFDRDQLPTTYISVLTDSGGRITTAFPGIHFNLSQETT
ncbi:MAG: hypothetical protein J0H74_20650 [Chitinophagaceae bacterium]|nr:hypothetical protein [Chitinophagaceae bacterium]